MGENKKFIITPRAIFWVIGALAVILITAASISDSGTNPTNSPGAIKNSTNSSVQAHQDLVANYLIGMVHYAHMGYLADNLSNQINSGDITSMMSTMMEMISDEKQAISFISTYASSTDQTVSSDASLLALSEEDVISKQEIVLDQLRQLSNGNIPSDVQYSLAEMKTSQDQRNDSIVQASQIIPYIAMDTSSIEGSSTATVGPLSPTSGLTPDELSNIQIAIQMDFGSQIDLNQNDMFLLIAQEIDLLLKSPTYADFHDAWISKVSNIPN